MGSVKLPVQCHNGGTTQAHVLLKGTRSTLHLPPASLASQLKGGEQCGDGSANGVYADNYNQFQTGHLHIREHYRVCCRGTGGGVI